MLATYYVPVSAADQRWISSFDVEIQLPSVSLAGRIIHIICSFVRLFICSFVHLFVCLFVHLFICSFVCLFVRSFVHSFVCSFVHLFVCSFIRSFVRLFVSSFVQLGVRGSSCVRMNEGRGQIDKTFRYFINMALYRKYKDSMHLPYH